MTLTSEPFTIDTLTDVFKAWRKPCELADLPPSRSCIVRERCVRDGVSPEAALRALLVVAITEGVEARRTALGIRLVDDKGVAATWLVADIRSGDANLQAWGALYHRYVKGHQAGKLALQSRYDRKTIRRYEEAGFALLSPRLQRLEDACLAARQRPAEGWLDARAAVLRAIREDGAWTDAPFDEARVDAWKPAPADDLTEYLADRVVLGSLRTRVPRGVVPTLVVYQDQGALGRGARWRAEPRSYAGLDDVLDGVAAPAIALLGPPGSGKTTLLARLEHDAAVDYDRPVDVDVPLP